MPIVAFVEIVTISKFLKSWPVLAFASHLGTHDFRGSPQFGYVAVVFGRATTNSCAFLSGALNDFPRTIRIFEACCFSGHAHNQNSRGM